MSEHVYDGDVDDSLKLAEELVSNEGAKDGSEVAERGKGVVDDGGLVLGVEELLGEVDAEYSLHAVEGEALAELVADDEENTLRIRKRLGEGEKIIRCQQS